MFIHFSILIIRDPLSNIPTYLRKYSAVSVYAHTLFKNITILKKSTTDEDLAKKVLEFLLKHKHFLMSKRADLHIELAKVFESQYKQLDLVIKSKLGIFFKLFIKCKLFFSLFRQQK